MKLTLGKKGDLAWRVVVIFAAVALLLVMVGLLLGWDELLFELLNNLFESFGG
jgi:hypothetical protein